MFTGTLVFDDFNQKVFLSFGGEDHLLSRAGGPGTNAQHAFATMTVVRDILVPPTSINGINLGGAPFEIQIP